MNLIYIGKIVNTHGLKGEVRIISDFKYKEEVFQEKNHLFVGQKKDNLTIKTYRVHKNYDMVTFDGLDNIDDVIVYKNSSVYFDRDELKIDGYLDDDLIGFEVYQNDKNVGTITALKQSKLYTLLVINNNGKEYLVPNTANFVINVDLENKRIYIIEMWGLVNED